MRAISKMNHINYFKFLQDIKASYAVPDETLIELERDLEMLFISYQQQINDIRMLIMEYDAKKKKLSQKVKQLLRNEVPTLV